jgi:hypothetical protein
MDRSRVQARFDASSGFGAQPSTAEETRAFYQKRISFFGQVAFYFLCAFYVISNTRKLISGERTISGLVTSIGNQLCFVNLAVTAAAWRVTRNR